MRQQIPTYSGSPSEDFITFKDKFEKAAEDNRISKTDQLEKLPEALTGNATTCIPPEGVDSVDPPLLPTGNLEVNPALNRQVN